MNDIASHTCITYVQSDRPIVEEFATVTDIKYHTRYVLVQQDLSLCRLPYPAGVARLLAIILHPNAGTR